MPRASAALVLLALASAAASGQATPPPAAAKPSATLPHVSPGRLVGVFDQRTGEPLDSVEVHDVRTGLSAFTTKTGTLSLFFVDTGGSMLRFRKIGYLPITMPVANSPRDTVPLTITLAPAGQVLPTVVTRDSARTYISPALRAFEERRREGLGHFVPEAALRKEDNRKLSDVISKHVPGIAFIRSGSQTYLVSGRAYTGLSGRGAARCQPDVYLDGTPLAPMPDVQNPRIAGVDLGQFSVTDFGAIEFHNTATLPARFNRTSSGCGALLLWSRER